MSGDAALVLLSGGQDSATCLAWALARFDRVETIGFDYGQRHRVELEQRLTVRQRLADLFDWSARLGPDHLIPLRDFGAINATAMTEAVAIEATPGGLPSTFVPGRNLMFLTTAAAVAYGRGIRRLVTGVCETDYSGYPDCRDDTMKALQIALNLGMDARFVIETPLMWIDKAATFAMARDLGGPALLEIIRHDTHTCYLGDRSHLSDWGYGCGTCPACQLRAAGYRRFVAEGL